MKDDINNNNFPISNGMNKNPSYKDLPPTKSANYSKIYFNIQTLAGVFTALPQNLTIFARLKN
jgi:hypothetical protein